jgi:hypothetical protein
MGDELDQQINQLFRVLGKLKIWQMFARFLLVLLIGLAAQLRECRTEHPRRQTSHDSPNLLELSLEILDFNLPVFKFLLQFFLELVCRVIPLITWLRYGDGLGFFPGFQLTQLGTDSIAFNT